MKNANVFQDEVALSLTKVSNKLNEAKNTAFTVCFNCKVKEEAVREKLASLNETDLKTNLKALAKELLTGRETTIVGRLAKNEAKMGRSLIIDLSTGGFAQVDHRTIKYLIIDNTKFTVKK